MGQVRHSGASSETGIPGHLLLAGMVGAAANKARQTLGGPVALTHCDAIDIRCAVERFETRPEAWIVRRDGRTLTVAVTVLANPAGNDPRIAAYGRFTLSPADRSPPEKGEPGA
jgi:hypothetical protein